MLNTLEDPVELWDTFKHETLEGAQECIGECQRSWSSFTSVETLDSIEESCAARFAWTVTSTGLCCIGLELSWGETRRDMSGVLFKDDKCHLNANYLRLANRALKMLCSRSASQVSAIRTANGCLLLDAGGQMAHWLSLNICHPWREELTLSRSQ